MRGVFSGVHTILKLKEGREKNKSPLPPSQIYEHPIQSIQEGHGEVFSDHYPLKD